MVYIDAGSASRARHLRSLTNCNKLQVTRSEEIGVSDSLRFAPKSDLFTPTCRAEIGMIRDLGVEKINVNSKI